MAGEANHRRMVLGVPPNATPHGFHRTLSNSLTWPSRHRSQSSTTQDSSRRSEVGRRGGQGGGAVYPPLSPFAALRNPQPLMDDLDLCSHVEEEYEEEARRMKREEVEEAVRDLTTETRVLAGEVARERTAFTELCEGVSRNLSNTEKRQEQTSNRLLRRLESLHRKKLRLQRQLKDVQTHKQDQEKRLEEVKLSIDKLKAHLKSEEDVISQRIQRKIAAMKNKRAALENALRHETYSIQQLEKLVNEFQHLDSLDGPAISRKASLVNSNALLGPPSVAAGPPPAADVVQTGLCEAEGTLTVMEDGAGESINTFQKPSATQAGGHCSRSGSQASIASSTTARHPGRSQASLRFLQKAIGVLEHLRRDAQRQEELYSSKTAELQHRVEEEMRLKQEELIALQNIQKDLVASRQQLLDADGSESSVPAMPSMVPSTGAKLIPEGRLKDRSGLYARSIASTSSYCDTLDGAPHGPPVELTGTADEESVMAGTEASSLVSHTLGS